MLTFKSYFWHRYKTTNMFVCIFYLYIYVCVCIFYIYVCIYIYVCVCVCVPVCEYIRIYVRVWMYIHMANSTKNIKQSLCENNLIDFFYIVV